MTMCQIFSLASYSESSLRLLHFITFHVKYMQKSVSLPILCLFSIAFSMNQFCMFIMASVFIFHIPLLINHHTSHIIFTLIVILIKTFSLVYRKVHLLQYLVCCQFRDVHFNFRTLEVCLLYHYTTSQFDLRIKSSSLLSFL